MILSVRTWVRVVFAFAKVINFMLITTVLNPFAPNKSCFCFCKGNQFYANHNRGPNIPKYTCVVFAFAKVINFMLITTKVLKPTKSNRLFLLLQR